MTFFLFSKLCMFCEPIANMAFWLVTEFGLFRFCNRLTASEIVDDSWVWIKCCWAKVGSPWHRLRQVSQCWIMPVIKKFQTWETFSAGEISEFHEIMGAPNHRKKQISVTDAKNFYHWNTVCGIPAEHCTGIQFIVLTPGPLHFAIFFLTNFRKIRLKTLLNPEIFPNCYTFLTFFVREGVLYW